MGWPFQTSPKQKAAIGKDKGSTKGFLEKLLGKPETESPVNLPAPPQVQQAASPWDLPDESFNEVAKLLEETKQKAPHQPLMTNPYRTSLSLDDIPGEAKPEAQAAKENPGKQWTFDANTLTFGQPKVPLQSSKPLETVSPELLSEDSPEALPLLENALDDASSSLLPAFDEDAGFSKDEDSLDDFGLTQGLAALPEGVSLNTLLKDNAWTFISENKSPHHKTFSVSRDKAGQVSVDAAFVDTAFQQEAVSFDVVREQSDWLIPADDGQAGDFARLSPEEILDPFTPLPTQSVAQQEAVENPTGSDSNDWFNKGLDESLDSFEVLSIDDMQIDEQTVLIPLEEEPLEESFVLDTSGELSVVSEHSGWSAPISDHAVTETSWFGEPVNVENSQWDTAVLSDSSFNSDEPACQQDDFQVVSLDSEDESEPSPAANDFFSSRYQFSLDNLQAEDGLDLLPPDDTWPVTEEPSGMSLCEVEALPVADEPLSLEPIESGHGLFEFQLPDEPLNTNDLSLDLDDDLQDYEGYLPEDTFDDEPVFELSQPVPDFVDVSLLVSDEAVQDLEPLEDVETIEPLLSAQTHVAEECLEPPPLRATEKGMSIAMTPVSVDLPKQPIDFEAKVLLQESRFTKQSIDRLVSHYFSRIRE